MLRGKWQGEFESIFRHYATFCPEADKDRPLLEKAFWYAAEKHEGQKRADGTDYFTHPVAVAKIAAKTGSDPATIAASLLHDVAEDCGVSYRELTKNFGAEIAQDVSLVTKPKLSGLKWVFLGDPAYAGVKEDGYAAKKERNPRITAARSHVFYERLQQSGNASALFVKLFDNLHNMRTIRNIPDADRRERNIHECLKNNYWLAGAISPSLQRDYRKAIFKGLKSLGFTRGQISRAIVENTPEKRESENRLEIESGKLFGRDFFRNWDPEKRADSFLVHRAGGNYYVRVPYKENLFGRVLRSPLAQDFLGGYVSGKHAAIDYASRKGGRVAKPVSRMRGAVVDLGLIRAYAEKEALAEAQKLLAPRVRAEGLKLTPMAPKYPFLFRTGALFKVSGKVNPKKLSQIVRHVQSRRMHKTPSLKLMIGLMRK